MEDAPQTPEHAPRPLAKKPDHKYVLYDPKSNTTMFPFIITKHAEGDIVSAVARPRLQKSQGHIAGLAIGEYDPQFKQKMPVWVATADGFRFANTIAGWSVTFPQQVHVPGVGLAPNPYIDVDKSGAFVKGFARAIGIGRSSLTGDLMIVDRPTHISVQSYIEEDLAGKAQYHPTAIVWGTRGMNPMDAVRDAVRRRNEEINDQIRDDRTQDWKRTKLEKDLIHEAAIEIAEEQRASKMWRFFAIARVELGKACNQDVGLWVNMGAAVCTRVFTTLVQKRKYGARLLPAVAERNVLRTALGFYRAAEGEVKESWPEHDRGEGYGKSPKVIDAMWAPKVVVHRMNFTPSELDDLRGRYLAGVEGGVLRQAKIDCEFEENSSENLLLVEPPGDADGGTGAGVLIESPPDDVRLVEELTERQQLLLDARKYQGMVDQDVADSLREVCFDDPVFVNLDNEPIEKVRKFVEHLKKQATQTATKEVDDEGIVQQDKKGDK